MNIHCIKSYLTLYSIFNITWSLLRQLPVISFKNTSEQKFNNFSLKYIKGKSPITAIIAIQKILSINQSLRIETS